MSWSRGWNVGKAVAHCLVYDHHAKLGFGWSAPTLVYLHTVYMTSLHVMTSPRASPSLLHMANTGGGKGLGRMWLHIQEAGCHCQYLGSNLPAPHSVDGVLETLLESSSLPLPRVRHHLHTTHTHTPCRAGQIHIILNSGSKIL